MTTTITVQTSARPAAVSISSFISSRNPTSHYESQSFNRVFVAPETKTQFSISDDASFSINELPKDATSLDDVPGHGNNVLGLASVPPAPDAPDEAVAEEPVAIDPPIAEEAPADPAADDVPL